ncbi:MAG: methylmalonyl-CoA mutase family protein [Candidatus Schekmanbacteria bacterium]|nr:methylmalonyl-CoA mutase family protein [Candidatus Schekmanbacteria bacterium]
MKSSDSDSKDNISSLSGIKVKRLYSPEDVRGLDYCESLGFPGEYVFTRGVHHTMYRGRLWTMRQFAGFGSAKDTNFRFRYLLEHGQTGLSVAFHLPTLLGRDSDHTLARGEVGICGVAIDSLADMESLFDKIPLDKVTTSMTINGPAIVLFAMYCALGEKQGVPLNQIRGTIQNDILKEYIAQKTYIYPPLPSIKIITDIFKFGTATVPKFNTISISGYHIREAGSTALQELAFTIADGIEYVNAGIRAGIDIDNFAPRLSFFFNSHNDIFEEAAKYRAARRIWARIMKERFKAKNPDSWKMRFHTQTAGCSLTAQQPNNNIVRVTLQALAGILGGTQSLHTNSRDETLSLPTDESVMIALRTQQVLAYESGITEIADPLGGSYFLESLTSNMEDEAVAYIEKIDDLGGMVAAIEAGFPQSEIVESSYRFQQDVDSAKRTIVGVNRFKTHDAHYKGIDVLKIAEEVEGEQVKKLHELKKTRDNGNVIKSLDKIHEAALQNKDLMLPVLEAVKCYATVGEICDSLRDVYGEYVDAKTF